MSNSLTQVGMAARAASRILSRTSTEARRTLVLHLADALEAAADAVLEANARDVAEAREKGMSTALLDRLLLTPARVQALVDDTRRVADLPDPVGQVFDQRTLPNGLRIHQRRIPLGVLGVIYEARPNVTVDVAVLAIKTGNAAILRGGSETLHSNRALMQALHAGLVRGGMTRDVLHFIDSPDRALVTELLRLDAFVDVIIPRGGEGLHRLCRETATIPVITGGIGICHLFVDESAILSDALKVVENAKVQRPSVCNALDTVLVHEAVAPTFLPDLSRQIAPHGVRLVADPVAYELLDGVEDGAEVQQAGPDDFDREWLSLVLGVRVVPDLETAIAHIQQHSTEHSDGILTQNEAHADAFITALTSAAVYVNASTRFTDGGQFGLGAEVAVSTQKLHARGPMGLEALTTYQWVVRGDGHVRA